MKVMHSGNEFYRWYIQTKDVDELFVGYTYTKGSTLEKCVHVKGDSYMIQYYQPDKVKI